MATITPEGYVTRITSSNSAGNKRKGRPPQKATRRDWWLVKYKNANQGYLPPMGIYLPKKYVGKRVKIKVILIKSNID